MSRLTGLYQLEQQLGLHLPTLSVCQTKELALYALGCICSGSCLLCSVVSSAAALTGDPANTVRQRLREWYLPAAAKRGRRRAQVEVEACFGSLLAWTVHLWPVGTKRRIALALDASLLKDRFTVLCISVLVGGIGIPVAWTILPANTKGAWNTHWLSMLKRLTQAKAVQADWSVLVLADRGLCSPHVYKAIVQAGWHPMMRVPKCAQFRIAGTKYWDALESLAARHAHPSAALCGHAFKRGRCGPLQATLLILKADAKPEPWFVLTDLKAADVDVHWYGLRAWIERQFRTVKRGDLGWHNTRMLSCERAQRLWLVLAVTLMWSCVCADQKAQDPGPILTNKRTQSCFKTGRARLALALLSGKPLPQKRALPKDNWNAQPVPDNTS